MTIRHLKIFIEVADSGKMSIAASKFYISQPTVSQIIRELEEHYHTRLFERISQKLYITPNGQALLDNARRIVADFDALEKNMTKLNQKSLFRIGVSHVMDVGTFSEVIDSLHFRSPDSEFSVQFTGDAEIEERLLSFDLDAGIMAGPTKSNDLINIPLINDYLAIVCPAGHPLFEKESLVPEDLNGQHFARTGQGDFSRQTLDALTHNSHIEYKCFWEASDMDFIKAAVLKHSCLALASVRAFSKEAAHDLVHIYMSIDSGWNMPINLVYPKKKAISEPLKLLQYIFMHLQIPEISGTSNIRTFILP